ncbi:MAG: hypothetical protein ACOX0X_02670 [Candidatus Dojkabacteria bacterium]
MEVEELTKKLYNYEKTLNSILLKVNRLENRKKKKRKIVETKEECVIYLSFAGLNSRFPGSD